MNKRLYRLVKGSWERFNSTCPTIPDTSENIETTEEHRVLMDHYWWNRVAAYILRDEPEAEY